jgi:hypothetical protein
VRAGKTLAGVRLAYLVKPVGIADAAGMDEKHHLGAIAFVGVIPVKPLGLSQGSEDAPYHIVLDRAQCILHLDLLSDLMKVKNRRQY